jgi:hypothetical protein
MRCEGASGSAVSQALVEWRGFRGIHSEPFHRLHNGLMEVGFGEIRYEV